MNQVNIKNIIGKSFKLYSEKFSLFTGIATVSFIAQLLEVAITHLRVGHDFLSMKSVGFFIGMIFLVIDLAMIIVSTTVISKRYNDEYVDLNEAFLSWSGRLGRYIGVMLIFILVSIIPAIIGTIVYAFVTTKILKYFLLGLMSIPVIYLMTIYSFAPYVAILESKNINSFAMSKNLVKNYFWKVILVFTISYVILFVPSYLIKIGRDYIPLFQRIDNTYLELIKKFIAIFTGVLTNVFSISLYYALKEKSEAIIDTV
ncbi:MAG: hypothetical protein K0R93_1072 [Anaerosolibacter sp.]|jgi:hypothetical protein|uniref:hypothetical protein n=1 Tax=Anaerosolibacter sp. TaxID=1872527 RepID=UPI002624E0DB|nr:hypothetical protein [Anaerosolibacter sp.]MDF2546174.1 hypothetical protein [Anaerosolibacter sp.]